MARKLLTAAAVALAALAPSVGAARDHGFGDRFHGHEFHDGVSVFGWWLLVLVVLLIVLGYFIASGRMALWIKDARVWLQGRQGTLSGFWRDSSTQSGNRAFDEYRDEALRRLEEEQREFEQHLESLRRAKDKAEFDEFVAERDRRAQGQTPQPQT